MKPLLVVKTGTTLPALRERREDIPALAMHFDPPDAPGFTPEAIDLLARAPWPGNVRQLRNAVISARAAAGESKIGSHHISVDSATTPRREQSSQLVVQGGTLREIERNAIVQTIESCGGNRTQAAQMLGIDRSTLRRKLKEFGIE